MLLASLALLLGSGPLQPADSVDADILVALQGYRLPGASIAVQVRDQVVLEKTYGSADHSKGIGTPTSLAYPIGSLNHTLATTLALILHEEGLFELDESIAQHLDALPEAWRSITPRHLFTHASGLADGIVPRTPAELGEQLRDTAPLFPPGTDSFETDSSFHVLRLFLAAAAEKPYETSMEEKILAPLSMQECRWFDPDEPPFRPKAYEWTDDGLIEIADVVSDAQPGELLASAGDLLLFVTGLRGDQLFSRKLVRQIWSPVPITLQTPGNLGTDAHGRERQVGLGWFVDRGPNQLVHRGSDRNGFSAQVDLYRKRDVTVVVLSNGAGGAQGLAEIVGRHYLKEASGKRRRR